MVSENLEVIKLNSTNSGCARYENFGKLSIPHCLVSVNNTLLCGIVCHLSSLILEVSHPSKELTATLM